MQETELEPALPRRIAHFPLVAMVIAITTVLAANATGLLLGGYLLEAVLSKIRLRTAIDILSLLNVALTVAAYKFVVVRLGESARDDLRVAAAPANLAAGLLIGFAVMAAVVAVAALLGIYAIVGAGGTSELPHELVASAIVPGFIEELLFRGILFRWLEEFAGSWVGLFLSSAAFGFVHYFNPDATVTACVWIALEAGLLLGGAYMLTRSLWMPIGIHAGWNLTQGFIFDVPVSGVDETGLVTAKLSGPPFLTGGQFGLEASVIALVIATGSGIALVVLAVRRGELIQPWWVRRRSSAAAL